MNSHDLKEAFAAACAEVHPDTHASAAVSSISPETKAKLKEIFAAVLKFILPLLLA